MEWPIVTLVAVGVVTGAFMVTWAATFTQDRLRERYYDKLRK